MAQTVEFAAPEGLTLDAKLYAYGSATVLYTASSVVEAPSNVYTATFSGVTAGTYRIVAFENTTEGIASYSVDITASGVFQAYDYSPASTGTTETNTTNILSLLQANPATSIANLTSKTTYSGDSFGASVTNGAMTFTTTLDTTGADSVTLVVYDKDTPSTIYKQVDCTATSSTLITADAFTVDFGSSLTFGDCPRSAECGFAVVAVDSGLDSVAAAGSWFVIDRADPV